MGDFNINLRLKYEQQCPDCGLSDFVEDHASGDLICRVRAAGEGLCLAAGPHVGATASGALCRTLQFQNKVPSPAFPQLRTLPHPCCCRTAVWWWRRT